MINIRDYFAFGEINSLGQGTSLLITPVFSIATAIVVVYFLIGAFKWLTSRGDKTAIASAQGMITHAIIGFILLMFAFLLLEYIPKFFGIDFSPV